MNNIPQSTTLSNTTAGTSCFDANHIDVTTIEDLEQVGSDKWTRYPGCIGAFIAEPSPVTGLAVVISWIIVIALTLLAYRRWRATRTPQDAPTG